MTDPSTLHVSDRAARYLYRMAFDHALKVSKTRSAVRDVILQQAQVAASPQPPLLRAV